MYTVLDKDTIEMEIIPHIPLTKRGFPPTVPLVEIVNAILYKLKTGVQWHQLPTQVFFEGKSLCWESVYYHYRKWSVNGVWKSCWVGFLDKHKSKLDLSSVDLDGSHTPALLPLQMQDIDIEQDVGALAAASKAMALLYEALVTPLFGLKILAFIIGLFLWLLDLFIYPLFLAERYFLLGIMQAFFPLVISLAVFEKFRTLAYNFFKLYAGVYMLVPAFFLVNVFVNNLYTEINTNFWSTLFGTDWGSQYFAPVIQLGSIGFIVLLKFKLYRRATSFVFKLFSA